MSNETLKKFMPIFDEMVAKHKLVVTDEQREGVSLLMQHNVTADQANQVSTMLHLAEGSDVLYINTIRYCIERDSVPENTDEAVDSDVSKFFCPHCGGRLGVFSIED